VGAAGALWEEEEDEDRRRGGNAGLAGRPRGAVRVAEEEGKLKLGWTRRVGCGGGGGWRGLGLGLVTRGPSVEGGSNEIWRGKAKGPKEGVGGRH